MKPIRSVTALLLLAFAGSAVANDFEAMLSSETAQFTFRSDSSIIGWGGADFAVGLFYNEDNDYLVQASLLQMRQASEQNPLTFGVGVKGYLGQLDDPGADVLAFAIGGEVRYTFPGTMPMALYARGFYAPKITSFSDSDEVVDFTAGFQIEALPQTVAFVGWRRLKIDIGESSDYKADDDNFHLGVRLVF